MFILEQVSSSSPSLSPPPHTHTHTHIVYMDASLHTSQYCVHVSTVKYLHKYTSRLFLHAVEVLLSLYVLMSHCRKSTRQKGSTGPSSTLDWTSSPPSISSSVPWVSSLCLMRSAGSPRPQTRAMLRSCTVNTLRTPSIRNQTSAPRLTLLSSTMPETLVHYEYMHTVDSVTHVYVWAFVYSCLSVCQTGYWRLFDMQEDSELIKLIFENLSGYRKT